MSYCTYVNNNISEEADYLLHKHYHDHQYGFPIDNDDEFLGDCFWKLTRRA
jgi:DNA-3-methyladenine glycosylase I